MAIQYIAPDEPVDTKGFARIMGLTPEQIRRRDRNGTLPPKISNTGWKRWRWGTIKAWRESGYQAILDNDELNKAILDALQLGIPIDQATLYGHYSHNLIDLLKQRGHFHDIEDK